MTHDWFACFCQLLWVVHLVVDDLEFVRRVGLVGICLVFCDRCADCGLFWAFNLLCAVHICEGESVVQPSCAMFGF